MKIFLSAIACNPYLGSESWGGWSAVKCLAQDHDLWVAVSRRHRRHLERADNEGLVPKNVHFIPLGRFELEEWHHSGMTGRLHDWKEYIAFSKAVLPVARDWHQKVKFDLAHHVTIATWRVATPLWKLDIPFVFGPVGGNEKFPPRFLSILSPASVGFELLRMLSTAVSQCSPSVRACMRRASHVFAANAETEAVVKKLRGSAEGVSRLMQTFFSTERIQAFTSQSNLKDFTSSLRLFAGGYMEGRKGVGLAIQGLARAKAKGVSFQYRVGNNGPEVSHLKKLAQQLGLQEELIFGSFPREEYRKGLGAAHVFLFPSLRDAAPATLLEAMLAGCVPVVADCGGPAVVVTDECGFKIPVSSSSQMINDLANVIVTIDHNRKIILEKGAAAAQRVATDFSEEHYRRTVNAVYRSIVPCVAK